MLILFMSVTCFSQLCLDYSPKLHETFDKINCHSELFLLTNFVTEIAGTYLTNKLKIKVVYSSLVAQTVKNLSAMRDTHVRSLG